MMRMTSRRWLIGLPLLLSIVLAAPAPAGVFIQCPANLLRDGGGDVLRDPVTGIPTGETDNAAVVCRHLSAGDGHIYMADRDRTGADPDKSDTYIFGFSDVTGVAADDVMTAGMLRQNFSAPTLFAKEGQELYLTLTNVSMVERPDLFDPHTVHFHGFPNAASVFDGEPFASIAINMADSLTYYYNNVEPGTYMFHCHVEASEHMQMGMLGNLYILPAQDDNVALKAVGSARPIAQPFAGFAYNDGDGSTGYDVSYALQETGMDPLFHDADHNYNPLPFADMDDTYVMFNGRGYPDTIDTAIILNINGDPSQRINSLITATQGQRILLRLSSLNTVDFQTVTVVGLPMQVVGQGARLRRGPDGKDTYYNTNSITMGGGEATDILLDTTNVPAGTYFLYTSNVNHLSNNEEDFGGMMTEIVIN